MTVQTTFDRRTFLQAGGILAIGFSMSATAGANTLHAPKSVAKEAVDSWLTISPDNKVTIFVGKVDLGTGSRTALMQLAADELDVSFGRIEMVMGDTATTPDQWLTAANLTIFQGGGELRRAAASARRALVERAAQRLGVPAGDLTVEDGVVSVKADPNRKLSYGEVIGDGVKLDVDAKIVGVELELIALEQAAILVHVHGEGCDIALDGDFPVPVAGRIGPEVDRCRRGAAFCKWRSESASCNRCGLLSRRPARRRSSLRARFLRLRLRSGCGVHHRIVSSPLPTL